MARYKCPTLGDCERANSGEVFERGPGEDLHCPDCKTLLELQANPADDKRRSRLPAIAAIVGAAVLVIGGGGTFYYKRMHATVQQAADVGMQPDVSGAASASLVTTPAVVAAAQPAASNGTAIGGGIAPSAQDIAADRRAGDKQLTSGDAAGAEADSNRAAAKEMIKVAIADMAQGKLDDAEKQLNDAQVRDPKQSLVYYNLGVLRLKQARTDDALKEFEASFLNGFQYFDDLAKDPDLDSIRRDPRFEALVKKYHPAAT